MFSQVGAQSEDLDLLGALRAGAQKTEVIQLAALRGALVEYGVSEAAEMGLPEEAWDDGGSQQEHQPRGEDDQTNGERSQCDGVLRDAEDGGQQAHSPGGLAA